MRGVAWSGELVWGDTGLQFVSDGPDAPPETGLDVPLGAIVDARYNPQERFLVLEMLDAKRVRFVGQGLEPVHAGLAATLADRAAADQDGIGDGQSEEHAVCLRSGPIIHRGGLRLDPEGLTYTPRGLLDTLVGVRQRRLEWRRIDRLTAHGGPDGLVGLRHDSGMMVLQPAAPDAVFGALLRRLHAAQAAMQLDPAARDSEIAKATAAWPGAEPPAAGELATLALHGSGDHGFQVGVLTQSPSQLRFLPRGRGGRPVVLDLHTLVRRSGRARGLPIARVSAGGTPHDFIFATGAAGVQQFWMALDAPSRVLPWSEVGPRTRIRLSDDAREVRVVVDDGPPAAVVPIAVHASAAAWTLVTANSLPDGARVGAVARVEIGQDEGMYRFSGVVTALRTHSVGDGDAAETTMELDAPGAVHVFNQRQGYRIGVRIAASARTMDDSSGLPPRDRIALSLHDLSVGGCRAHSEAMLPVGATLDLSLELPGWTVRAQGSVLREGRSHDGQPPVYGIRFDRIGAADEDRIHRYVLEQQREELQVPSTDEPSLPDQTFR